MCKGRDTRSCHGLIFCVRKKAGGGHCGGKAKLVCFAGVAHGAAKAVICLEFRVSGMEFYGEVWL